MNDYVTRPLAPDDVELVCRHRRQMFAEMFIERGITEPVPAAMIDAFREWLRPRLANGTYTGWVVEREGQPVGGIGMMILDWPPHPSHPTDSRRAYILNVFVDPPHRGRGLATLLMKRSTEEAQGLGIRFLTLHATRAGRPVYEKLGWLPMPEMSLQLK